MDKEINEYYQLQQKYESKVKKQKTKILNNDTYSLEQKKQRISMLKYNCIRCGKEGGTIFSNKNRILRAVCGNKNSPCGLNITINRKDKKYVNIEKEIEEILKNIIDLKNDIMRIKLELLFEYIDEATMLKRFTNIKGQLSKNIKLYDKLTELKITQSEEESKTAELEKEASMIINQIKSLGKNLNNETEKDRTVRDMVDVYVNVLEPKLNEISERKYLEKYVISNEDEYILIQNKENVESLEVNILALK